MSFVDPYLDPDSQANGTLQAMVTRLEERGRHAGFSRMTFFAAGSFYTFHAERR